ncbi:MarC family protein [Agrobacterium sp. ES01]|uniref:MarC family protein n=1 Tax=Agrobacterium sp. ES01 TaxID=3420714 RepID=UPI003D12C2B7
MASGDILINAFTTLLVTLDPPGLAPLFLGLTSGMNSVQRRMVALRGTLIAFAILAVFAIFGARILDLLGISIGAFRIAGGILLFAIAFEMIFEKRQERKEKARDQAVTEDHAQNIAVFPLALPLIAGPGAISATILLSGHLPSAIERMELLAVIAVCMCLVLGAMLISGPLNRFLGNTGRMILTRLLGVLLAALSVQFVVDGVKSVITGA